MVDTRESNPRQRPGQPDMPKKRRTPAQVRADNAALKKAKEDEAKTKQRARKRVAEAEDKMAIEDMEEIEKRKTNSTRPRRGRTMETTTTTGGEDREVEVEPPVASNARRSSARQRAMAMPQPDVDTKVKKGAGKAVKKSLSTAARSKDMSSPPPTPAKPENNKKSRKRARSEVEEPSASEYNPEDSEAPTPGPDKDSRFYSENSEQESELTDVELIPAVEATPKPPKKKRNVDAGRGLHEAIKSERVVPAATNLARTDRLDERQLDVEMRDLSGSHSGGGVGTQPRIGSLMPNHSKYAATLASFASGSVRHTSAPSSRASSSTRTSSSTSASSNTLSSTMRTKAVPHTPFAGHRGSDTQELGGIVSDDETVEHAAAQASPEKTPVARLTHKAFVQVKNIDVTATPTQTERRAGASSLPRKLDKLQSNNAGDAPERATGKKEAKSKLPSKALSRQDAGNKGLKVSQSEFSVDGRTLLKESEKVSGAEVAGSQDKTRSDSLKVTTKRGVSNPDTSGNGDNPESGDGLHGHNSDSDGEDGSGNSEAEAKKSEKGKATEKKKKKWTTKDLPDAAHINNRWRKVFVPTLIHYMGTRARPWAWDDRSSVNSVQMIWDAVYGGRVQHVITFNDPVHFCATQRLYDWRKAIGYWASQVLDNFFDNDSQFSNIAAQTEYCAALIEGNNFRFVYERPFDEKKGGLFQNVYVLRVLASHLDKTNGAIDVPGLYINSAEPDRPVGAIALAAAAVERILELWARAEFKGYNDHKRPSFQPRVDPKTGKEILAVSKFCTDVWLDPTNDFADSADNLSSAEMAEVVSKALVFSTITHNQKKLITGTSCKSDSRRRLVSDN